MQGFGTGLGHNDNMCGLPVLWAYHGLQEESKNTKPFGIVTKTLARVEETVQSVSSHFRASSRLSVKATKTQGDPSSPEV